MTKKIIIRNSTVEFLVFATQSGEDGIEVRIDKETVWLTQKMMAKLFECSTDNIALHLKNIYGESELDEKATSEEFSVVQKEGKREVNRKSKMYSLSAIIAVGYRVNSQKATQFRQWATRVLEQYAVRGYVLDNERLKNGTLFGKQYFDDLISEIREIRSSERRFYQKITDIYSTAMDYDLKSETTKTFFKTVQNKLHFAIHGNTAAELIMKRASKEKQNMGLATWKNYPKGKIIKSDVSVAKNYLGKEEIESLNRIVSMYLDYAEDQARRNIPMTMEDWSKKLSAFLQFNEREILEDAGKVTAEIAKAFAESEFEEYRIVQDRLFESDFDREMKRLLDKPDEKK